MSALSNQTIEKIKEEITKSLYQPGYDGQENKLNAGPVLVRLAWHASGTYDAKTKTGGSNGATMRYAVEASDPANAGLDHARKFLEPIKIMFPEISYADLWTLAGVTAIEAMGGPKIPWLSGRLDFTSDLDVPANGRLPDASKDASHLRNIFYRMGFNDQEIVALSGAHNLGRCHKDRSGFDGPWVNNPYRFSNIYFKFLKSLKWVPKQWDGPFQYVNEKGDLMMLPTDLELVKDPEFKKWVDIYADDKEKFFNDFSDAFAKLIELGVRDGIHAVPAPPRL